MEMLIPKQKSAPIRRWRPGCFGPLVLGELVGKQACSFRLRRFAELNQGVKWNLVLRQRRAFGSQTVFHQPDVYAARLHRLAFCLAVGYVAQGYGVHAVDRNLML